MAPNAHDRDDRPAEEADLSARLQRLGEQLDQQRTSSPSGDASAPRSSTRYAGFARGFRLSSELVAGVLVGAVIGWSLDHWLGIAPWGMIVFLLVGFAAGVLNVMRAAGVVPGQGAERRDGRP
ncbi:AtpZ/AtpI family protein [Rhodoplanes sp. SY1]|uniref:AtpZ/AtpI family protein n=1 Tax=Rhodoplanes sp. SY1 TaxID=3166646 RepID=UPI0038B511D6